MKLYAITISQMHTLPDIIFLCFINTGEQKAQNDKEKKRNESTSIHLRCILFNVHIYIICLEKTIFSKMVTFGVRDLNYDFRKRRLDINMTTKHNCTHFIYMYNIWHYELYVNASNSYVYIYNCTLYNSIHRYIYLVYKIANALCR